MTTVDQKKNTPTRSSITRSDLAEALKQHSELSASDLAETLKQHNENILRMVSSLYGWTPERQAEMREEIGDLGKCYLGDGSDGLSITRDPGTVKFLAAVYRLQLLLDTETEPIN
jgi:hypothetical protein